MAVHTLDIAMRLKTDAVKQGIQTIQKNVLDLVDKIQNVGKALSASLLAGARTAIILKKATAEISPNLESGAQAAKALADSVMQASGMEPLSSDQLDAVLNILSNVREEVNNIGKSSHALDDQLDKTGLLYEMMKNYDLMNAKIRLLANSYNLVNNVRLKGAVKQLEELDNLRKQVEQQSSAADKNLINQQKINEALEQEKRIAKGIVEYVQSLIGPYQRNKEFIDKIIAGQFAITDLNKAQKKELLEMILSLKKIGKFDKKRKDALIEALNIHNKINDSAEKLSDEIITDLEKLINKLPNDLDKVSESIKKSKTGSEVWNTALKSVNTTMAKIDEAIPGVGQFAEISDSIKLFGNRFKELNSIYEENHTVNKVWIVDNESISQSLYGIAAAAIKSSEDTMLWVEAQKATSAVLNDARVATLKNKDEVAKHVMITAELSRATGMSEESMAAMSLRMHALTGDVNNSEKMLTVLINTQAKNRLSTAAMAEIIKVVDNNMIRLTKSYGIVDKNGKTVAKGSEVLIALMGELGENAAAAGSDATLAMQTFATAIERPLDNILLLGPALASQNIGDQFLTMGDRADMFYNRISKLPPAIQSIVAQKMGTSVEALKAASDATAKYRDEYIGLSTEAERRAKREEIALKITEERQDKLKAEEARTKALATANRALAEAWTSIAIIFGTLVAVVEPFITMIAELIKNPIAKWLIVATAGLIALGSAFVVLGKVLPKIFNFFEPLSGLLGRGLEDFAKSLQVSLETFGKINWIDAIKSSGFMVIFAAALAAAVLMLGGVMYLVGKHFEGRELGLAAALTGIVAAAYVLKTLPADAQLSAMNLAKVGGFLAVGLMAIGLASLALPKNKAAELLITVTAVVGATYILSKIPKDAQTNAIKITLVGLALVPGLTAISIAANLLSEGNALELAAVLSTIIGATYLLSKIPKDAKMSAIKITLVGLALAPGLAAIAMAANLLPKGKIDEMIVVLGSLIVMSFILGKFGAIIGASITGALAISVLAVALGVGVAALAFAINMLPNDWKKFGMFAAVITSLIIVAAILIYFASVVTPAIYGALAMAVFAVALGVSVAALAFAINMLPNDWMKLGILLGVVAILGGISVGLAFLAPVVAPAVAGALAIAALAIALGISVAALAFAMSILPDDIVEKANLLFNAMGGLTLAAFAAIPFAAASILLAAASPFLIIAMGTLVFLAHAMSTIPDNISEKAGSLTKAMLILVQIPVIPLIFKAAGLVTAFTFLRIAIGLLNFSSFSKISKGLETLFKVLNQSIDIDSIKNINIISDGLWNFAKTLAGSGFMNMFSGDASKNADELAYSLNTLAGPIKSLSNIGEDASKSFKLIGEGLGKASEAFRNGAFWGFFDADQETKAKGLANALSIIKNEVVTLSMYASGDNFRDLGEGLKYMAEGLNTYIDPENANRFKESMISIRYGIMSIYATQTKTLKGLFDQVGSEFGNVISEAMKPIAEEIKSSLDVKIEASINKDEQNEMIELLASIDNNMLQIVNTSTNTNKKLEDIHTAIAQASIELMMNGSSESTANINYA